MKRLTRLLFTMAMLLALSSVTFAKTFSVCITDNYNEMWALTNTYVGNGIWSLSGCWHSTGTTNTCWTISGTADAKADTFYAIATNGNQDNCAFLYDYVVWRGFKAPGDFQGYLDQWCYCCGESPGTIVLVSCKVILGSCPADGNPCGQTPNKDVHGPAYKDFTGDAAAVDNGGMDTYFKLLHMNMTSVSVAPNPAASVASIKYNVADAGSINVTVYNSIGQAVKVLVNDNLAEGSYTANWDLKDSKGAMVPKGDYFIRIQSTSGAETQTFSVNR